MQAKKSLTRILKVLGKAVVGLVILMLLLILLMHVPAVQQSITRKVSGYLSTKLKSKVEIEEMRFSILGHVSVKELRLEDPLQQEILSIGEVKLDVPPREWLSGKMIFNEVLLSDVRANLTQDAEGLNIDFILNAFGSPTPSDTTPTDLRLQFRQVTLKNVDFRYQSVSDSMDMQVVWQEALIQDALYATQANAIDASLLRIAQPKIVLVQPSTTSSAPDMTSPSLQAFQPDFGIGIGLQLDSMMIVDGVFENHADTVFTPTTFDPNHLLLDRIQMVLANAMMQEDTLSVEVQQVHAHLQGVDTMQMQAMVQMNKNTLVLDDVFMSSSSLQLEGDTKAWLTQHLQTTNINAALDLTGKFNTTLLDHFKSMPGYTYVRPWGETAIKVKGEYINTKGTLRLLDIRTPDSHVHAEGTIHRLEDLQHLSWENLRINAVVGSDFKRTINAIAGEIALPPSIYVDAQSTGNIEKLYGNIDVQTSWGTMAADGSLSVLNGMYGLDLNVTGQRIQPGRWTDLPWLGPVDATMTVKGTAGRNQDLKISGMIHSLEAMQQPVHDIAFESQVEQGWMRLHADVKDPAFKTTVDAEVVSEHGAVIEANIKMDQVQAGRFIPADSSLVVSGQFFALIEPDESSLLLIAAGENVVLTNATDTYAIDSFDLDAFLYDDTINSISYTAPDASVKVKAKFNLMETEELIHSLSSHLLSSPDSLFEPGGTKELTLSLNIRDDQLIRLFGINTDTFSTINIEGYWSEPSRILDLEVRSQALGLYNVRLNSMEIQMNVTENQLTASGHLNQLSYNTAAIGDLRLNIETEADTIFSSLSIQKDSTIWLDFISHLVNGDDQFSFYPDQLRLLKNEYAFPGGSPITWQDGRPGFDDFRIERDSMQIRLDGHKGNYHAALRHLDLRPLNAFIPAEDDIIDHGMLSMVLRYEQGIQLNLDAHIDSLILYDSAPLKFSMTAHTEDQEVPFQLSVKSGSDQLTLDGRYAYEDKNVKANATLDISDPQQYSYLFSSYIQNPKGAITAEATINGYILDPKIDGHIRFKETSFETPGIKMRFLIRDEDVAFTDSSLFLKDFTLLDETLRPLNINGQLTMPDHKPYAYDFQLETDRYTLLNTKEGSDDFLSGRLIVSTKTRLSGTEDDTYIQSNLHIDDSTSLVYMLPTDDDGLTDIEGIVEFVAPERLEDSTLLSTKASVYDSLLATLPQFNLTSSIIIEDQARLKIIIDSDSGDYIESIGGGKMDMEYDRTGNLHLAGNYTIQSGVYRLSFYGLVKRNFNLVQGSSIDWSGNPRTGDLDIKAVHTVQSNSIGLIGNEISENEKSIYKRSLDYEIGININGTLEKPNVFFTLDLPAADKANYPVLANKLDRLRQPEFQSELNKQVFGLLALGGFLPESSTADVSSTQIATTALYNSVNSVLTAQLNRFAGQYLKGVNIDVGLQSYSDYSTAGGKTQTAMDFRVSKSILDDRLSFEVGGDFDINTEQSGSNTGDNYRGDVAIIYDLTGNGDKQLKLFNNESYDIVYQEIRNTGISLIFIREFNKGERKSKKKK